MSPTTDREALADAANLLGLDGIEFIEYATSRPQALGQVRTAAAGQLPMAGTAILQQHGRGILKPDPARARF